MTPRFWKLAPIALAIAFAPFVSPAGAQATACKDGTSSAASGRGACSGHGGVAPAQKRAAVAAAKVQTRAAKTAAVSAAKVETRTAKAAAVTAAAQVKCTDGSSTSASGRGACSGHGGIDRGETKATRTAAKADVKAAKAEEHAAASTVKCTDGAMSAGGRGACSGHGGIAVATPAQARAEKAETRATAAHAAVGNGSAEDNNPVGSIAKCKDGMYSHSKSRRGACGHHGGVANWS